MAWQIREILSRIYSYLKEDGVFVYCSSDYRMAIRFDSPGFFDDRFLGVDLRKEVERFFEPVGPLFDEPTLEANPLVKKMVTGKPDGLAHPAFVYHKRKKAPVLVEAPVPTKEEKPKKRKIPKKLVLLNRLSPGDILVMTNAVRDLCKAYPGEFQIDRPHMASYRCHPSSQRKDLRCT